MAEIITKNNFEEKVLKSELPVLVDFYADWCGPCKMLAPTIDKLAQNFEGKVNIYKVNIDTDGELAASFGIMTIPTTIIFKNGEIAYQNTGLENYAIIESRLNSL